MASRFGVSGACFTVGSEKGILVSVAAHSNLNQRFRSSQLSELNNPCCTLHGD